MDSQLKSKETKPEPCLWIRDLEDVFSESGQAYVGEIRKVCLCKECTELRRNNEKM
jgi:hypothetical protein